MNRICIAGIGTEIGKTLVSAIIAESLQADYWKPIQAGNLEFTDSDCIRSLISNERTVVHPESYRLKLAASPHAAAAAENTCIKLEELSIPETKNILIIELAGGLLVPLNEKILNIDLVKFMEAPVILVSKNYLGSINHTLMSIDICIRHGIDLLGIIFNGERNKSTEDFIIEYSRLTCIGRINHEKEISKETVKRYAGSLKEIVPIA